MNAAKVSRAAASLQDIVDAIAVLDGDFDYFFSGSLHRVHKDGQTCGCGNTISEHFNEALKNHPNQVRDWVKQLLLEEQENLKAYIAEEVAKP